MYNGVAALINTLAYPLKAKDINFLLLRYSTFSYTVNKIENM